MKHTYLYTVFIALVLVISSCRKGAEILVPYQDQEAAAVSTADFFEATQETGELFTIDLNAEGPLSITTQLETTITFEPDGFLNGWDEAVTGIVDIEVIEVGEQGDMMIYDKPTVIYLSEELLHTEREIYIKVTQEGSDLQLAVGKQINIQLPSDELNPNTKLYSNYKEGAVDYWIEEFEEVNIVENIGYDINSKQLGWLNIATTVNANSSANVCPRFPSEYNYRNTLVYIVYEDINGLTRIYGDPIRKEFCGDLPNGMKAQLVVIALRGKDDYYFDIQDITISDNLEIMVNPSPSNLQGIIDFLAAM